MKSKYCNDYSHIDWQKELDEYFNIPYVPIRKFAEEKPYSYWAVRDRIRKDPRYRKRKIEKYTEEQNNETITLLPVVVQNKNNNVITVNGFQLEIDSSTDSTALQTVLKAMRNL